MNQYQVQEFEPFEPAQGKYYIIEKGKSGNLRKEILGHLQKQRPDLEEVCSVDDCNVILVFCPVVSRAGTDIDAALNELNTCSASKPAILMVLHHSLDPDKIVPESSRFINRRNTLTVDCLFNDMGLLTCNKNEKALAKIVQCFKYQKHFLKILAMNFSCPFWWYFKKCLYRGCCWIFRTVAKLWTGEDRGTCESNTNNENSRLIDGDGDKNA